ncbi:MAG: hypothetical protein WC284_09625 [Candidimonas sp.]
MKIIDILEDVFHGSPHRFDKFSTSKIGTGEGAQAYGWGLYFSGKKEIADWYRKTLSMMHNLNVKTTRHIGEFPSQLEQKIINEINKVFSRSLSGYGLSSSGRIWFRNIYDFYNFAHNLNDLDDEYYRHHSEEIEEKIKSYLNKYKTDSEFKNRVQEIMGDNPSWDHLREPYRTSFGSAKNEMDRQLKKYNIDGHLYSVSIPDDGSYLLWDREFSQQPNNVKKAISDILFDDSEWWEPIGSEMVNLSDMEPREREITKNLAKKLGGYVGTLYDIYSKKGPTGQQLYREIAEKLGSEKSASLELLKLGVPGIKYLDGISRRSGDGGYNYVIFDENAVKINESRRTDDGYVKTIIDPTKKELLDYLGRIADGAAFMVTNLGITFGSSSQHKGSICHADLSALGEEIYRGYVNFETDTVFIESWIDSDDMDELEIKSLSPINSLNTIDEITKMAAKQRPLSDFSKIVHHVFNVETGQSIVVK